MITLTKNDFYSTLRKLCNSLSELLFVKKPFQSFKVRLEISQLIRLPDLPTTKYCSRCQKRHLSSRIWHTVCLWIMFNPIAFFLRY
ncbi:unnamed protein product [Rhizophagus irregularis]|uniref:Uncharacterized protein n=1 Tax=Rhizophagus irregularis TaxID=588596 RepID=A0A915Z3K5_9GLOM|nr:unnamed protein product [Rhizophagus irregularis]